MFTTSFIFLLFSPFITISIFSTHIDFCIVGIVMKQMKCDTNEIKFTGTKKSERQLHQSSMQNLVGVEKHIFYLEISVLDHYKQFHTNISIVDLTSFRVNCRCGSANTGFILTHLYIFFRTLVNSFAHFQMTASVMGKSSTRGRSSK